MTNYLDPDGRGSLTEEELAASASGVPVAMHRTLLDLQAQLDAVAAEVVTIRALLELVVAELDVDLSAVGAVDAADAARP